MTSGRQPDIGPNTSRSLEARRIIDRRLEAECGDRADTRQVMNLRTCTSRRASLWTLRSISSTCCSMALRASSSGLTAATSSGRFSINPSARTAKTLKLGGADDETEVLKQATDLVLEITLDLDQQRPARQ